MEYYSVYKDHAEEISVVCRCGEKSQRMCIYIYACIRPPIVHILDSLHTHICIQGSEICKYHRRKGRGYDTSFRVKREKYVKIAWNLPEGLPGLNKRSKPGLLSPSARDIILYVGNLR